MVTPILLQMQNSKPDCTPPPHSTKKTVLPSYDAVLNCIWGTVCQVTLNGLLRHDPWINYSCCLQDSFNNNQAVIGWDSIFLEPVMSNQNKEQCWALWTETDIKCINVAISPHDWTKIFSVLNNQNCLFCKTTFFQYGIAFFLFVLCFFFNQPFFPSPNPFFVYEVYEW